MEWFLQLEKSYNGKVQFCDSPSPSCQMIHTAARKIMLAKTFKLYIHVPWNAYNGDWEI